MSLFDPSTVHDEARLFDYGPDGSASGEQVPELSETMEQQLLGRLKRVGVRIARSQNHLDGWEDAFNTFAEALEQAGCVLTEPILSLDIPNMLFNFALVHSWSPHLKAMLAETEVPPLTFPKRIAPGAFSNRGRNSAYRSDLSKEQSIGWFRDRIRPAVMEWTALIIDRQEARRNSILYSLGREFSDAVPITSPSMSAEEIISRRKKLLSDYLDRVKDEDGKPYASAKLYKAKQHSMHKPQFYQWLNGTLKTDNPATVSFERFLNGKDRPLVRKFKE